MAFKFRYTLSDSFRRYSKNTAWIFGEKAIRILILIPVTSIVARYLGPEQMGMYNLAIAMVSIFMIFAMLGIPQILVREIVKDQEKTNQLVTTAIVIRMVAAFVFYAMLLGVSYLLNYSRLEFVLISFIGLKLIFQSFDAIENYLEANVKLRTSSKIRMIALVVMSTVKLILVYKQAPLVWFGYAYGIEFAIIMVLFIIMYMKMTGKSLKIQFSPAIAKMLLVAALPLIYYTALMTINMKVDQVMISKILGSEANGYYSVVVALIETLYFIPVALGTSVFPGLIKQHQKASKDYLPSFQFLYEIMLAISIIILIGTFVLAPYIIQLLFGDAYHRSVPLLRLYALCPIFMFYGSMRNRWLIIEDLMKYAVYFLVTALTVNIALNFILLPLIGIEGAIVALLASYFTSFLLVPFIIPATRISVVMFFRSFLFKETIKKLKERRI